MSPNRNGTTAASAGHRMSTVAVLGATGYVGSQLVPALLMAGFRVRCLVRNADKAEAMAWGNDPGVEIFEQALDDADGLAEMLAGCQIVYYLVHSMAAGGDFARRDTELAAHVAEAAGRANVRRVIYLGGMGEPGEKLSDHLRSRQEVGRILRRGDADVTELRAAVILGARSESFLILRYLVERLPVMVTPKWVRTECQPIAIDDVVRLLVAAAQRPETAGLTIDIGGPDVLTYQDLMDMTAESLGLPKRKVLRVPVLTPGLSSRWIGLVTPASKELARPLAEGLRNRVVARDNGARELLPPAEIPAREAVERAVEADRRAAPDQARGLYVDKRSIKVRASRDRVFRATATIGIGPWHTVSGFLWRIRTVIDRLLGGPGLRSDRPVGEPVSFGDVVLGWRVTGLLESRRLKLTAGMVLPGHAELEYTVSPDRGSSESTLLVQRAIFRPQGLAGIVYWNVIKPFHAVVFRDMLRHIERTAMNPPPAKRPDSDRRRQPAPPQKQPDNHNVDESVEETFPASDPPALSLERRRQAENDRQRDEKRAREHADSRPTPPATERNP